MIVSGTVDPGSSPGGATGCEFECDGSVGV